MDLSFNLAPSYRDLKDPTSRQNFEDTVEQKRVIDVRACHMAESFQRLSFSLMDQVKIFIVVLSSINDVLGLRWQGPAGYYRRLLDLPSICPHISLASPWSAPSNLSLDTDLQLAEREKELLLLKIRNISLIVTGHISLISTDLKVWHVCCIQFIPICGML